MSTTVTGYISISAVEFSGSTGNITDKHSFQNTTQTASAGVNPINAPTVTTTVNGDLVLSAYMDGNIGGSGWTDDASTVLVSNNITGFGSGIAVNVQSMAGSITPKVKYGSASSTNFIVETLAIEPSAPAGSVRRRGSVVSQ